MKVLHYVPSLAVRTGGVAAYLAVLSSELGKLVDLHIATHDEGEQELETHNAVIHRIPPGWLCYFSAKELLKELRPDVVHINGCWQPQLLFFQRAAQSLRIPVVLSPHGMLEPWIVKRHYWTRKWPAIQLYQRGLVKRADCLHATADTEKDNLLRLGWNPHIALIPNAVNLEELPIKDNWSLKRRIVFMSRLHVKKGIELLLEALSHLKPDLDGYEVIIAGEGEPDYVETLKKAAISFGLSEVVKLVGGVYGAEKVCLLQSADFFVLPTYSENFGIVVAEALACGTPVITTHGTPWKELEDFACGWYIQVGLGALEKHLQKAISASEEDLKRMGLHGRKLVENKFTVQAVAQKFLGIYKTLAKHESLHLI
jgi:glycosyltransferase, group 1 family protein